MKREGSRYSRLESGCGGRNRGRCEGEMKRKQGPLTLEKYRCFFVDPWDTPVGVNNLNHILNIHGFCKLHHDRKVSIMRCLVGQVDLLPPRRSTLHQAARWAGPSPSAAVITTAEARADIDAIGWAECPIGCVASFSAQAADAPEPVERGPRTADFVVVGRRPRSKRTRTSAYKRKRGDGEVPPPSTKVKVMVAVKEEKGELSPPPTPPPPPLWMRSPTPPPPPSSPSPLPPQDVAPPPPPPPPSLPPPLPPQDVAPPPPPQTVLAPVPAPPCWGSPAVRPLQPPQLYWGLPLPTPRPGTSLPGLPSSWASPTVPSCYPAPFWGAPCVLPPLSSRVPWDCRPSNRGTNMSSPTARPPEHLQQESFPAHFHGQQPPPAVLQTPPPPLQLRRPPPHLQGQLSPPPLHLPGQQPPPAPRQAPPPPLQLRRPPPHLQGHLSPPPPPLHLPVQQPPPAPL